MNFVYFEFEQIFGDKKAPAAELPPDAIVFFSITTTLLPNLFKK